MAGTHNKPTIFKNVNLVKVSQITVLIKLDSRLISSKSSSIKLIILNKINFMSKCLIHNKMYLLDKFKWLVENLSSSANTINNN